VIRASPDGKHGGTSITVRGCAKMLMPINRILFDRESNYLRVGRELYVPHFSQETSRDY
jgi:hypothetical protein